MRPDELYLYDMLRAADDIITFLEEFNLTRFVRDRVMRRAVLQALTEIGEAASHISEDLRQRYPDVPWDDARAFRNFAVHQYFAIYWNIVWETATVNIPDLHPQIRTILASEFPDMTYHREYAIVIFYSDEDECYVADIPDLRSCSAFGDTPEEALHEIQIARDAWMDTARDHGHPIPEPSFGPPFVAPSAESPSSTGTKEPS